MYLFLVLACSENEKPQSAQLDVDQDGYTTEMGDCDDFNNLIFPSSPELCDNIDNNCNNKIDEEAVDSHSYFLDNDGDGYPTLEQLFVDCNIPENGIKLSNNTAVEDCNDSDASIHPNAARFEDFLCTFNYTWNSCAASC